MAELVTDTNFVRAETDRMFAGLQADAGGVNTLLHHRAPAPLDHQTVIRMNRDTLYSLAIVDISEGATLTVPDSGGRYLSVMIVNEDHYINRVLHEAGDYELTIQEFNTPLRVGRCAHPRRPRRAGRCRGRQRAPGSVSARGWLGVAVRAPGLRQTIHG